MTENILKIIHAEKGEALEQVRILWRQFAELLKIRFPKQIDNPFFIEYLKNYEEEIANRLPGRFGPPNGCLLLAKYQGNPAGCVGLMDLGDKVCEMRRLFVREQYRGLGIGKSLAKAVIEQGKNMNYASMRLNTNRRMMGVDHLYRSLGFKDIKPYEHFEVDGMIFLELKLK
jgi:GNAT superfamily N-acetyltransferase